jgi:molybdate transport system ATP-binding protein
MADDLIVDFEKRFASGVTIAADLRVSMRPGRIVVLFGPSGSGKTTIVRAIAGLERPDRGVIRYGDESWFDSRGPTFVPPQNRSVGYVFQDAALFPHLTVRANVEYGLRMLAAGERNARVEKLLAMLEIADLAGRYPRHLSGGQAQRVALGRSIAPARRLLLLDEPFAALDTPARAGLRHLLRATIERLGIAAVLVTHDRSDAIALGDEMAVVAEGRIRQLGLVLDVFRRPADLVVARSVGIESVVPARVEGVERGLVELRAGDALLRAVDMELERPTGDVFACIRAEDVTLERSASPNASARNHLPGRIVSIDSEGPLERVTVDCGFSLAALITRHAREELLLEEGGPVVAAVKATAIHLVPRG